MSSRKLTAIFFGKARHVVEAAQKSLKDEIDITHIFTDSTPSTVSELQSILQAGPGPDYILTGNGFLPEEFAAHHNVEGKEKFTWVYGAPKGWIRPEGQKPGPPTPEILSENILKVVQALKEMEKDGEKVETRGGVWTWAWPRVEEYEI